MLAQPSLLPEATLHEIFSPPAPHQRERTYVAHEYKVVSLREIDLTREMHLCDTPERAADYWRSHVQQHPYFNSNTECMVVLLLNSRRRILGHHFVSNGTLDTILVHSREVFRAAIVGAASAIVLMHNHPSGESSPSDADIRVTRDLIRAGQLLKIEVLDHVVVGQPIAGSHGYTSLRETGYFAV